MNRIQNWLKTTDVAFPLDKALKKDYTESNTEQRTLNVFDDVNLNNAVDYLYTDGNASKTQEFLKNNGFPSVQDRELNKQLYGVQEEQKQMRDLLKSKTNGILNPTIPTDTDRAFLKGLMGDDEGEHEYQQQISSAIRAKSDLLHAFRGTEFESKLKPALSMSDISPEVKQVSSKNYSATNVDERDLVSKYSVLHAPKMNISSNNIASNTSKVNLKNTLTQTVIGKVKGKNAERSSGEICYEGHRGCINGQGSYPGVKDLYYGKDTIANNGCELLAVYNALVMKDKKQDIKNLITVAETTEGVMWFGGRFGSYPKQLGKLLKHYEQEYTYTTRKSEFNGLLEDGGVYIISAWNPGAIAIHTMAFSCDSEKNIIVYNRYSQGAKPYKYNATEKKTGLDLLLEECGDEIIMYKLK